MAQTAMVVRASSLMVGVVLTAFGLSFGLWLAVI